MSEVHSQQMIVKLVPCFGQSILVCAKEVGGILEDIGPWSMEGVEVELFNKGIEHRTVFFVECRADRGISHKGGCERLEVWEGRKEFWSLVENLWISCFDIEVDSFDRVFDILLMGIFIS